MRVAAAILAAGRGERFGADKTALILGDKPVWRWSYDTFAAHPAVEDVFLVTAPERLASIRGRHAGTDVIAGGQTRRESSSLALDRARARGAEVLLLQDAARPFTSPALISAIVTAIEESGAAAPAVPVTDTIKEVAASGIRTLDRSNLVAMQTPQGARVDILTEAHRLGPADATDDMALVEAIGVPPRIVPGDPQNFKITTPDDFARAIANLGVESRTGMGYDIHAFSDDPARELWLGGVCFPGHRALLGHSDADVLLHAITDALLGAAAMGDIGVHFPPSDERWRNHASIHFVRSAADLLRVEGWQIVNVDATCVAESPKIMLRAAEMAERIGDALGIDARRVSIKATTNEGLGTIGRGEGIAAFAIATIKRPSIS